MSTDWGHDLKPFIKDALLELRHAALASHEDAREMYIAGALMFMRKALEAEAADDPR